MNSDTPIKKKGRLKIYLGMCPGVGKTFAMLQAAREKKGEGVHLVIGIAETHGRKETEELLKDLPIINRKKIPYKNLQLEEMDIDAILAKEPTLAIVDELAHSNIPGSRHPKRYQDVLELLDAGISVYTTLNVQHIESRVDVVRQITGVTVHEKVPDSILDRADEIQVIDLSPEQLQIRLNEGKVYLGEGRAEMASIHFFKQENLTALREITLRLAAERTDQELRDAMKLRRIAGPWKTTERLMVAVGPSPHSESLIRLTRRIAGTLGSPWLAIYVEQDHPLSAKVRDKINRDLSLARQLGAEVLITSGNDISNAILRIAKEQNITQIIIGKPKDLKWKYWFHGGNIINRLIKKGGTIDIRIVEPEKEQPLGQGIGKKRNFEIPFYEYGVAGVITCLLTLFLLLISPFTGYLAIAFLYLLLVIIIGIKLRRGPVLFTATLSAMLWNFLFIPPKYTFYIGKIEDALVFGIFFIVAIIIGHLAGQLRIKELIERRREQRISALYLLAQQAAFAPDLDSGLKAAIQMIQELLQARAALLLRKEDHTLSKVPHPSSKLPLSEKEVSVAVWAFGRRLPAGKFTDTLPHSQALHLPLQARTAVMGVLSVEPDNGKTFDLRERELLEAIAGIIASILEKDHFIQAFKKAELYEESEKLKRALLDSVSHELKIPVATIQTGLDALFQQLENKNKVQDTIGEIKRSVLRLNRVINNLLDMTRIQAGVIQPKAELTDIQDIIDGAIELAKPYFKNHRLDIQIEPNLPMVYLDQALIEQCLYNLILNACYWSPEESTITLKASLKEGDLILSVLDEGKGIKESDLTKIFDKFYRASDAKPGGVGLGLSIVQGFVQAHKGEIVAKNRAPKGAEFVITLPIKSVSV